jgi:hypothetical protein
MLTAGWTEEEVARMMVEVRNALKRAARRADDPATVALM